MEDAVSALEGIRADEVAAVMMEVQRSVTRHTQLVPKICDLVHAKRSRSTLGATTPSPFSAEMRINEEVSRRRAKARTAAEIEDAWGWERNARIEAGLHVAPIERPLNQRELDAMPPAVVRLGINSGFLKYANGQLIEVMEVGEIDRIRDHKRRSSGG